MLYIPVLIPSSFIHGFIHSCNKCSLNSHPGPDTEEAWDRHYYPIFTHKETAAQKGKPQVLYSMAQIGYWSRKRFSDPLGHRLAWFLSLPLVWSVEHVQEWFSPLKGLDHNILQGLFSQEQEMNLYLVHSCILEAPLLRQYTLPSEYMQLARGRARHSVPNWAPGQEQFVNLVFFKTKF